MNWNGKKVLVLAAHPDDETLGCGATLVKLSKLGAKIKLLTFTDGVGSRNLAEENRNHVLDHVCKKLGIESYVSGNFPDNEMDQVSLLTLCKFIEENTGDFKPEIVFTHHPDCLNIDHALVYRATITVFRPQPHSTVKQIYSYYVPSSTDYNPLNNFVGNAFFDVNEDCHKIKMNVLSECYGMELRDYPHTRSLENISNLMKVNGSKIGRNLCESFQLIQLIDL